MLCWVATNATPALNQPSALRRACQASLSAILCCRHLVEFLIRLSCHDCATILTLALPTRPPCPTSRVAYPDYGFGASHLRKGLADGFLLIRRDRADDHGKRSSAIAKQANKSASFAPAQSIYPEESDQARLFVCKKGMLLGGNGLAEIAPEIGNAQLLGDGPQLLGVTSRRRQQNDWLWLRRGCAP